MRDFRSLPEKPGAPDDSTIMMERFADPLLQLEIDEWILDYLIFSAIKALLEDYKSSRGGPDDASNKSERASVCLQLVDCKHS